MSWSLRNQMLLPLVIFVVFLAFLVCFDRAALEVKYAGERAIDDYRRFAGQLSTISPQKRKATVQSWRESAPGWHFVVVEDGRLVSATLQLTKRQWLILESMPPATSALAGHDKILLAAGSHWYYVTPIRVRNWSENSFLICLEPWQSIASTVAGSFRRSSWLAYLFSAVLIAGAALYSSRLSGRVVHLQRQVERIAAGDLSQSADEHGNDEISTLGKSINTMASELDQMKKLVQSTERVRLLNQLASGLAHELRNGIHSARLSLEIYQESVSPDVTDSASLLDNAHAQLSITETLVRRLLGLNSPGNNRSLPRELTDILNDVLSMTDAVAHHSEVTFERDIPTGIHCRIEDSEAIHAAILNICLNAIEAAGRHGDIHLTIRSHADSVTIQVSDSGPGPDKGIADSLFEPFTTTKPEGVGLGLALVKQAINEAGGTVDWKRVGDRTIFTMQVPSDCGDTPQKPADSADIFIQKDTQ